MVKLDPPISKPLNFYVEWKRLEDLKTRIATLRASLGSKYKFK